MFRKILFPEKDKYVWPDAAAGTFILPRNLSGVKYN